MNLRRSNSYGKFHCESRGVCPESIMHVASSGHPGGWMCPPIFRAIHVGDSKEHLSYL
jgi:hypothetical protein